jgi:tRNA (guanine-N7-)-methyltransferase
MIEDGARRAGAFFGRRKGKKMRQGQAGLVDTLLPRLRIDPKPGLPDPAGLFPGEVDEIWLEIGFGGGEHLAAQARAHPRAGIIGCEPFVNGMAKLLSVIDEDELANVRLYDGDALAVIEALPDGCLSRVYLLYPDPWPKRRHNKRRFVSDTMLERLARVMKPGGRFHFASDIDHYVGWTLRRIQRAASFRWTAMGADDWRQPFPGWPGTRYEAKALAEGRTPSYITAERL